MADAAPTSEHRTFAVYFLAQAAVGLFFWFVVTGSDEGRRLFDLMPGHPRVTDAFLWADLLAVATSLGCAWALSSGARWAVPLVAFTTGCIVYPTIYLIAWAPVSSGGAHCLFIMVPPSLVGIWITRRLWRTG
jgi:hypothetical protein